MNIDNYSDEELYNELKYHLSEWQYWETSDKRFKRVKFEINWHKAIVIRDRAELQRRGLPVYY